MMRARRRLRSPALALLAVILAACTSVTRVEEVAVGGGTTRGGTGGTTAGSAGTQGSGGGASGTGTGAGGATGGGATGGSGTAEGGAGDGTTGAGGGTGGGTGTGTGTSCTTPVKLGVSYSTDFGAGFAAVGEPERAAEIARYTSVIQETFQLGADDLTSRGGIAGCPVEVVFHDFSVLAADGFDGQSQRECAHFAEDERVFAVHPTTLESRVLIDCLAQAGVGTFFSSIRYIPTQADYANLRGSLYQPARIVPDRWAPFIDALQSAGYFGGDPAAAKVGILISDDGSGNNEQLVSDVWKPRLAELGIPVVREFTYSRIQSFSTVGDATVEMQSAALQFKIAGVTHLLFTPDSGDSTIFFGPAAENAGFRARWGTTSASGAAAFGSVPAAQREGAMLVSFTVSDLLLSPDPEQEATNPPSDARARCDALYEGKTAGLGTPYAWCDELNLLHAALEGSPEVTLDALRAGVERLGSFDLADAYGPASFGPDRYAGGNAVRIMAWDNGSEGWKYASPPIPIP